MKTKTKTQQFYYYYNKVKKSSEAWRLQGYTLKDNILKIYLYLFHEGYIKINSLDDFIFILDNSTLCPCNTEIIDKNNLNDYEATANEKKLYKKNIKILHYANPQTKSICECDILIPSDIIKIIKFVDENKENFIIKGAIWFDRINGNSYNSTIIYDLKNNKTYKKPFEYGYGRQYYYDSIEYLINNNIIPNIKAVHNYYTIFKDMGSFDTKKNIVKNHLY